MRDHVRITDDGQRTPVADMTTEEIQECLQHGVAIREESENTTAEDVMERLRLELFIRERGLR
jgi:hypothetical protein